MRPRERRLLRTGSPFGATRMLRKQTGLLVAPLREGIERPSTGPFRMVNSREFHLIKKQTQTKNTALT